MSTCTNYDSGDGDDVMITKCTSNNGDDGDGVDSDAVPPGGAGRGESQGARRPAGSPYRRLKTHTLLRRHGR